MKSPADQQIIQIDITNACTHRCANCTRFCGHHRKPFFMDFTVFKKAVNSLLDYPGMIGVMGGEPTLHLQFAQFAEYLAATTGLSTPTAQGREPIRDFNRHKLEYLSDLRGRRGLWTSLGDKYYQHFEIIQDVFEYQCINDHRNSGLHQALLISRQELGIPDAVWIKLRDDCWIQKYWSASITPKGAFFCEVAAALDMLFDGPGGWPVEPGWWRRTPDEFGDQLQWCELCSAALNVPRSPAATEIDNVSPLMLEKLRKIKSPKLAGGKVKIFDVSRYSPEERHHEYYTEWYLPDGDNSQRVGATNRSIYPRRLDALCAGAELNPADYGHFDKIASAADQLPDTDWVTAICRPISFARDFRDRVMNLVLNPGCIYVYTPDFKSRPPFATAVGHADFPGLVYFLLFNTRAISLRSRTIPWQDPEKIISLYPPGKVIVLADTCDRTEDFIPPFLERRLKSRMMLSHVLALWKALTAGDRRIAVFPGGLHTRWLLRNLHRHNLPLPAVIVDDNPCVDAIMSVPLTAGGDFDHNACDAIYICNLLIADKLLAVARSRWPESKIVYPYEFFTDPAFDEDWVEV